jgi:FtsP/CotA-like multicopper oxidase with cupredoxin domain
VPHGLIASQLNRREFIASSLALGVNAFAPRPLLPTQRVDLRIGLCSLEVAPGRWIPTTSYISHPPGSAIELDPGIPTQVTISNSTSESEFVHWHGLSLPASLDGTPEEQSHSIAPSSSLSYILPPQNAGLYFIHSHAMAMHNLSRGPYSGQFAPVTIGPSRATGISWDREFVITSHEWLPAFVDRAAEERSLEAMHHLRLDQEDEAGEDIPDGGWDIVYRAATINGRVLGAGEPLQVKQGERVMLRVINASATEPLRLSLPAHRFHVLTLDGYPVPCRTTVEVLSLGVGERVEALVLMDSPGVWILGSPDDKARSLGMGIVIEYADRTGSPIWNSPDSHTPWSYASFAKKHEPAPQPHRTLGFSLERRPPGPDGFDNWAMVCDSQTAHLLHAGERVRITLINATDEPHPMHLHRMSFDLVRIAGVACTDIRKDTVTVAPFQQVELDLTPAASSSAGPALFHCHNQMHMDCGLSTLLNII